jgi:hypothetical protein
VYRHLVSDAWARIGREDTNGDDMMVYLLCFAYVEMLIFLRSVFSKDGLNILKINGFLIVS